MNLVCSVQNYKKLSNYNRRTYKKTLFLLIFLIRARFSRGNTPEFSRYYEKFL